MVLFLFPRKFKTPKNAISPKFILPKNAISPKFEQQKKFPAVQGREFFDRMF